jgi:hypothetical protein
MGKNRDAIRAAVLALPSYEPWIDEDEVPWSQKDVVITSDAQDPQPAVLPAPSSSSRKRARGPNGMFCSGGRSGAVVTIGNPIPSPASPTTQLVQQPPHTPGPSTSAGPSVPTLPSWVYNCATNIIDPATVIQAMVMYRHETVQLYLYQFTVVCPGCHSLHDVNTICSLNPSFIGTALDWHSPYSKKLIPLPTISWGQPPLRYEPGNRTTAARFTRWPNQDIGYFLGRIGTFLAPLTNENCFQHN